MLFGLVLLAIIAYASGLHGSFLFDDFSNLPALGATGPVDTWPTFWRYITSGTADPTGRPLTLLTFLIDAHNWPADPYPFKRTNLILHLLNGVLLALLLRRLGRVVFKHADNRRIDLAAVAGAGFWLLHPLFVSTTLYIVQREAMLPATFTLLGLLAWLHGREAMVRGHRLRGGIWVALGLGGCTLLGVLSKANGILLPALALVVEYVFLANVKPRHANRLPRHRTALPPLDAAVCMAASRLGRRLPAATRLERHDAGHFVGTPLDAGPAPADRACACCSTTWTCCGCRGPSRRVCSTITWWHRPHYGHPPPPCPRCWRCSA
ncbi:hypothetical protein [Rhodanobacter lindaniclasticus]